MQKKGKDLIFISRILRDGKNVDIMEEFPKHLKNETLELKVLSLSEKTYVASGFNSYVVRLKTKKNQKKIYECTLCDLVTNKEKEFETDLEQNVKDENLVCDKCLENHRKWI